MNATDSLREFAQEQGFDLFGVAPASPPAHAGALGGWLDEGFAAGMEWMRREPARRADPREALPGAKTVVVVGMSYFVEEPPGAVWNDPMRGRVSRYAWGPDYHDVMAPRLEAMGRFIGERFGAGARWRAYVDSGPVLERGLAERAGVGFVGRNAMLVSRTFGSFVFLGEILTTAELDVQPEADVSGCGRCRRCLDACPTAAFRSEYVLDARRCISYHTIENRGAIPAEIRARMKNWIFGCDDCQSACPWVKKFSRPGRERFLAFDAERFAPRLPDAVRLDEAGFRERYAGTPVLRAKWRDFVRNAIVALGNSGAPEAADALRPLSRSGDALIREHAQWALNRL